MSSELNNILLAHYYAKKVVILHGSSGFGKSSRLNSFAEKHGFEILEKRTCYTDPIEVQLPVKNDEDKVVDYFPSRWLSKLCEPEGPKTMLFLDEFNRPSSMQTFSMFTEALLDRSINGMKFRDNVLIVAACNLGDEDTGVMEIPDAVLKRATNIPLVPDQTEIMSGMRQKVAREVLKINPKILAKPAVMSLDALNGNPRQIDATAELWEVKDDEGNYILNENDIGIVARGRVGTEIGSMLANTLIQLRKQAKFRLPQVCEPKNFEKIFECEDSGMALEVITMLKDNAEDEKRARHVADYLLQYATPETCRALHTHKFTYKYPKKDVPVDKDGKPYKDMRKTSKTVGQEITQPGHPWQMYALQITKMSFKSSMAKK